MAAPSHLLASETSSSHAECTSELSSDSPRTLPCTRTASAATATPSVSGGQTCASCNTPATKETESINQLLQEEVDRDTQSAKRPRPLIRIRPAGGAGMPFAHVACIEWTGNPANFTIVGKCPHPDCTHTRIDRYLLQDGEYEWVSFKEGWAIGKESSSEELNLLPPPCRFQSVDHKPKGEPPFRGKFSITMA